MGATPYCGRVPLSRFDTIHRSRPVRLVAEQRPGPAHVGPEGLGAPCAAVEVPLTGSVTDGRVLAGFTAAGLRLEGWFDGRLTGIDLTTPDGAVEELRSRRHGKVGDPVDAIGATLTGRQFTLLTRHGEQWTARAKVHLDDPVDPATLENFAEWRGDGSGPLGEVRTGPFGQLGLRDLHLVTHADGSPYERDGLVFLTATHAGPGFFDTAHCGVWSFDREIFALEHRGNLWFRREGRDGHVVYGDHATHLIRHGEQWLAASSTWGDFTRDGITITLARSGEDLLGGDHVLDAEPLDLDLGPGLPQPVAGVWDPHLTLIDGHWHLAFVAARRFFNFYPALARATKPDSLDGFTVIGAATSRKATEGTIIIRLDDQWRVVASDGRDNRPEHRAHYPIFDLGMEQVGALDAPYGSNLPWPTLIPHGDRWLLLTFDGSGHGGPLTGYGTHGDVLVMSTTPGSPG